MGGGPPGLWHTVGLDLRGKIVASGCELRYCSEVADALVGMSPRGSPVRAALDDAEQMIAHLAASDGAA